MWTPHLNIERAHDALAWENKMPSKAMSCDHVVPGCAFTAEAPTEEALLQKIAAHAREAHGVTEVTPELLAKVKSVIVTRT